MKYYEIIYNSSQKNKSGGVGFGVRTVTESMPEEYLDAIQEREIFSYDSGQFPALKSKDLLETPAIIRNMPSGYLYTKISLNSQKTIYILARKIPVGFDYTYYLTNQAGRLGNYVVDCYVFEQKPDASIFEMLYENPASNSHSFLPKDPDPYPENEEMKRISIGQQEPLSPEEKEFKAKELSPVNPEAIEILFAYIESRNTGKPLVVCLQDKQTTTLVADFYRLLPPELATDITFCTNHQEEGVKKGFDLSFINEYYQFEVYPSQVCYLDLIQKKYITNKEKTSFYNTIKDSLEKGDFENLHNITRWIASDRYKIVKDKSAQTNKLFYKYSLHPQDFTLNDLHGNEEFLNLLSEYIAQQGTGGEKIYSRLKEQLSSVQTSKDLVSILKEVLFLEKARFSVDGFIKENQKTITNQLLSTPSFLVDSTKQLGIKEIKRYFDKQLFEDKFHYLDDPLLKEYWAEIYPYFYSTPEDKADEIIAHTFRISLSTPVQKQIFEKLVPSNTKRLGILMDLLQANPDHFISYWPLIEPLLSAAPGLDSITKFNDQLSNKDFAPLFYHQIKYSINTVEDPKQKLEEITGLMEKNEGIKKLIRENFNKDGIYPRLFDAVKRKVSSANHLYDSYLDVIEFNVLNLFDKKNVSDWILLVNILANDTKEVNKADLWKVKDLALEIRDYEYFKKLLPQLIEEVKDERKITELTNNILRNSRNEKELLELLKGKPDRVRSLFYASILKIKNLPFKEAQVFIAKEDLSQEEEELLYEKCYPNEYKSLKNKLKIRKIFQKIFPFLFPKKKTSKNK